MWELYDVRKDFSLANNLAAQHPDKLEQMQDLFMIEAAKYNVLPIDDRTIERTNPPGRPARSARWTHVADPLRRHGRHDGKHLHEREEPLQDDHRGDRNPRGRSKRRVLIQGGRFGGWSLHLRDGKPAYEYNWLGPERFVVESPDALPAGKATVKLDFAYDGGGLGKGGVATLSVNGKQVAEGRIGKTQPNIFSADETADVGLDNQTPVALGIGYGPEETKFTGKIDKVTLEVK